MKTAIKAAAITLASLIFILLIAIGWVYIYLPELTMAGLVDGAARMAGYEIDTVHVDRSKRGDILDCMGRTLVTCNERFHPYGNLAASILGYVNTASSSGIERVFWRGLNGHDGYDILLRNLRTGEVRCLKNVRRKDGPSVRTSLDIAMQSMADSVLRSKLSRNRDVKDACIIIASTRSGAVRTMANLNRGCHGEYSDSCNTAISFRYSPGMMIAPAAALAEVKCDSTKRLCGLASCDMASDCDRDTLRAILEGSHWDDHFEPGGVACLSFDDGSPDPLQCEAPALNWLRLYTAIARGGDGISLWITGWAADDDNCLINDEILLASDRYRICSDDQAAIIAESLSRSLGNDILRDARYMIAGSHGTSSTASADTHGISFQSSFAGFFPSDAPVLSIICMLHFSPTSRSAGSARKLTSEIVRAAVDSPVVAEWVENH